jgi:SAM-dependent methyltransferase
MSDRIAYSFGFHPWEDAAVDPPLVAKIPELFEREEEGRQPPYASVLDIGTGRAIWGIELAKRGWRVTGIDIVDKALRRGRERASTAGVDMKFVQGDVTKLEHADVGAGFRPSKAHAVVAPSGRALVPAAPCSSAASATARL